ncbi:MAG TPA: ChaN family lipoprotein [Brumimicrobium sp.]|nr:ChaN family lipoprotein [Brumimicrobium sp.]
MKYFFLFFLIIAQYTVAQSTEPFQIYKKNGKKISTQKFLRSLELSDVVLFGELHDNPISHWLQLKAIQYLHSKHNITLGAEMLESHNQKQLDAYLAGEIPQEELDSTAQLWVNYKTDYKPLVDFAKMNQLPFIATNIPRKYASYVYRNGLESLEDELDEEEKALVAPLPIAYDPELPGYKSMLSMMSDHSTPNFPKAQAIKDATMAHFIYEHFKSTSSQFIHFNGDYHSKNFEGIYWYLKRKDESLNVLTISTVEQENVKKLIEENNGLADFIIVVDKDMTKTY